MKSSTDANAKQLADAFFDGCKNASCMNYETLVLVRNLYIVNEFEVEVIIPNTKLNEMLYPRVFFV
jgi:hypothetical protein